MNDGITTEKLIYLFSLVMGVVLSKAKKKQNCFVPIYNSTVSNIKFRCL